MILLPNFLIRLEKELNNAEKENQAYQKEVRLLKIRKKGNFKRLLAFR